MPDTQQRCGFLPSCFANERKHKPIGQLATSLQNKKNVETNLLEQALAKEICHLDQPQLFKDGVHLVDPISASKKSLQTLSNLIGEPIGEAKRGPCAKVNHMSCFKDDIVIYQAGESMGIAEIQLHFLLHDLATTLVKSWLVKEWIPHKQCAICQVLDHNLGVVPTADIIIIMPVICHKSTGTAKALLPYPIYSQMLEKRILSRVHALAGFVFLSAKTGSTAFHQASECVKSGNATVDWLGISSNPAKCSCRMGWYRLLEHFDMNS